MTTLVFATNNKNKIKELSELLGGQFDIKSLEDIGCTEELEETQETLEGNATQKAEFVATKYHVNCFADDTGLEIKGLGGAPGVYSARYAGPQRNSEDNMNLVLENLKMKEDRSARFRTVVSLFLDGKEYQFEGIAEGRITETKSGQKGFGYDPIFQPLGYDKTFAELTATEKNEISHRGIAVRALIEFLKKSSL